MRYREFFTVITLIAILILSFIILTDNVMGQGSTTLTIQIKSWDKIGIDANKPTTSGPNHSIIQARICNNGVHNATNVTAIFTWTSATNSNYIYLHPLEQTTKNLGSIKPGECKDVFYVVEMARDKDAKGKTRPYVITISSDNSNSPSAGQTLTVVGLISQSQDEGIYISISNPSPTVCETFQVYAWMNVTRTVTAAGFPIEYNPGVVELLSISVNSSSSLSNDSYYPSNFKGSHLLTYTFHAVAPGTITINLIIQDFAGNAYHYNSNFDTIGIPPIVIKEADIQVIKSVENTTPYVGETVNFTITVINQGPDDATGVVVTDILPSGFLLVSTSQSTGTTYDPLTGIWNIGTLLNGSSVFLTLTGVVTEPGNFTNTAVKTYMNEYDPNTTNDQDNATITALPKADVELGKIVSDTTPNVGDSIIYTIELLNLGPSTATGVTITDILPAGVTHVSNITTLGSFSNTTGIWTVGTLATGSIAYLNITVTIDQPGSIINWANKTSQNEYDPNTDNDNDSVTIYVPSADIVVNKTVDNATVYVGDTVTFTITATNNGPDTATGVIITDILPTSITPALITKSPGTSYSLLTGNWTIGTLTVGATATLTVTATVEQTGTVVNTATKTAMNEYDPNTANDTDNVTVTVLPKADLYIDKLANNTSPDVGDTVNYTIEILNLGPSNATGVTVTDTLPGGVNHVSNSTTLGTYNNATGLWTVGTIPAGHTASLTITITINQYGNITNWANITTANEHDPNPENNQSNITIIVQPPGTGTTADISVIKTVDNSTVYVGDTVTFTITATNNGPDTATGVIITDIPPPNLTPVSHSQSPGTSYDILTGIWIIGTLPAGSTVTLIGVAIMGQTGIVVNTATKTAMNEYDPNTANDTDNVTVTVLPKADLRVVKLLKTDPPQVGDVIWYTIKAVNLGPSNATGVIVTDLLPPGLSHVSNVTTQGTYTNATGIWSIGTITSGVTVYLNITVQVTQPGFITNWVNKTSQNEYDPNTDNDNDSVTIYVPSADIVVNKTVDNFTVYVGDTVTFTITATNNGPDTATGVIITDIPPPNLTLVSHSQSPGTSYDILTGIWIIGTLPAGSTVTLIGVAIMGQTGIVVNTATKTAMNEYDPNTANDTDNVTITVLPKADIKVEKIASDTAPNVGDTVNYTIEILNLGPSNATGVIITDILPTGVTYVSNTTSQGPYNHATGTWLVGNITNNGIATLNILVTMTQTGFITNWANKTAMNEHDPNPNNDQDNVIIYAPSSDLELSKSVNDTTPNVGSNITYTLTVVNNGPDTATGIVIDEVMPQGIIFISHVASQGTYNSLLGIWQVGSLPNGSTAEITLVGTVNQSGNITNTAEVISVDQFDPDSTPNNNNSSEDDQESITITGQMADLSIIKSDSPDPVVTGSYLIYTLNITNHGPSSANNVTVTDTLPSDVTFYGATPIPSGGSYPTYYWNLGTIPAGNYVLITINITVSSSIVGVLTNIVNVTSDTSDTNLTNNEDIEYTIVCSPPTIVKTIGNPNCTVIPGVAYCVTTQTPITFDVNGSCPALIVDYRIWNDSSDTGWITVDLGNLPFTFTFAPYGECVHNLSLRAYDTLGNIVYDNETFFVDNSSPIINKTVGIPNYSTAPDEYYVSTATPITIDVTDSDCCPNLTVMYRIWYDGAWIPWTDITEILPFTFNFIEQCTHILSIMAYDCLGHIAYDNETFFVNHIAQVIEKSVGNPNCTIIPGEEYCVTTSTDITINISTIILPPLQFNGPITVNVSYRVNGGPWNNITGLLPYIFQFNSECSHYLEIIAIDIFGNIIYDNETFFVDDSPPLIMKVVDHPNCIVTDNEYCVTTSTPITISSSGTGCCPMFGWTTEMSINGGPWTPITVPYTFSFTEECEHTLSIRAYDCLGNTAYDNETFHVDDSPPTIIKVVGDPNCTVTDDEYCVTTSTPITISSSGTGCCPMFGWTTEISINGGPWTSITVPYMFSFTEECEHTLSIRAYDCLGNTAYDNETFHVDNTPPEITKIVGDPHTLIAPDEYSISIHTHIIIDAQNMGCCPNTNIMVEYRIWFNGTWTPWVDITGTLPFTLYFTESCKHVLSIRAYDCLGNIAYDNETFYVDNNPPRSWLVLELDYKGHVITPYTEFGIFCEDYGCNNTISDCCTIHFNIKGPTGGKFYWNGVYYDTDGSWHTGSPGKPVGFQIRDESGYIKTGHYVIQFYAVDCFGIVETPLHTQTYFPDNSAPTTTLLFNGPYHQGDDKWISSRTTISLEASDIGSGVKITKYRIDNGLEMTYSGPFSIAEEGIHTIQYYSEDWTNKIEYEKTSVLVVDNTPPETTVEFLGDRYNDGTFEWITSSTKITLSSSDSGSGLSTIQYRLNREPWTPYTEPFTLKEGRYTLEISTEDYLGNVDVYTVDALGIDNQAPSITFTKPRANCLYIAGREILTLPFTGQADVLILGPTMIDTQVTDTGCGAETIQLYIDGELRHTSYDGSSLTYLYNKLLFGIHTIEIRTQDMLGHTSSKQLKIWMFNL